MAKKKPSPKTETSQGSSHGGVSRFQTFAPGRVNRRDLKAAPYNPRDIDDYQRAKLKAQVEAHGLVETLVWNKRTGNLVGGHQRISILDQLEGTDDYMLDVAVVDLPLKQEMELNVALNNQHAMGSTNIDKLIEVLTSVEAPDMANMGLTIEDLELQFGELPELRAEVDPFEEEETVANQAEQEQEDLRALRNQKRENRNTNPDLDANYSILVVFPNNADRLNASQHWGITGRKRFMSADELLTMLAEKYRWREVGAVKITMASISEQMRARELAQEPDAQDTDADE